MLAELFYTKWKSDQIQSENGSTFTTERALKWLDELGVKIWFIVPGSPWETGYIERVDGMFKNVLLIGEFF